ncbi:MAG: VOC family protein [Candidatus Sulfotelmatobacter sp.]
MREFVPALALASLMALVAPTAASAQALPPNEAGVTMGHWHLNSVSVETNQKLFVAMGGSAIKPGDFNIVRFPGVMVFLHLRETGTPPTGGTEGTIVNHVGLAVPNLADAITKWKAAGVQVMRAAENGMDQAWVTTADGLRVSILEDKTQSMPIRHDHIHFSIDDAAIPQMQAWYVKHFGAKPGMRNETPVAELPGTELRFTKAATPVATTKGRILDHIGFDVSNLKDRMQKLAADGVKIERPFTPGPLGGGLAFIVDPWGTYIELNERPKPL